MGQPEHSGGAETLDGSTESGFREGRRGAVEGEEIMNERDMGVDSGVEEAGDIGDGSGKREED